MDRPLCATQPHENPCQPFFPHRWPFLTSPHDNPGACSRLGYVSPAAVGYTGYNGFSPSVSTYHPSDVTCGGGAGPGAMTPVVLQAPPAAHSQPQPQPLAPVTSTNSTDLSDISASSMEDTLAVRSIAPDQLDDTLVQEKRIATSSRLKP